MGLITLVGLVTIGLSTYLILYSGPLYQMLSGPLRRFERKVPFREAESDSAVQAQTTDFVIIGLGNYGGRIARRLAEQGRRIFGADFDPEVVSAGCDQCLPVFYGDMGHPELLEHLPLDQARWVVSTIRDRDLNLNLLRTIKERKFRGRVAITARWEEEAEAFIGAGADLVLRPYADAAEQAAEILTRDDLEKTPTHLH